VRHGEAIAEVRTSQAASLEILLPLELNLALGREEVLRPGQVRFEFVVVIKGERGYDPNQHQQSWDTAWHSLTQAAGFAGLRFHDLRHTFITHMVELGVPLGVIQTFVRHMSARMVRNYTHVSSGAARKAVELLDSDPILTPAAQNLEQRVYRA